MSLTSELERRRTSWEHFRGRDDILPQELRDEGVYGGGRGIWRDKSITAELTNNRAGVVVSVLHLGQRYANDLHSDGIVYHYPNNDTAGYDHADIQSIKSCHRLGLPVFVISHGKTKSHRKLDFGQIVDLSDDQCLILFGEQEDQHKRKLVPNTFHLNATAREKRRSSEQRQRDPMFRYWVSKRCGMECGFCGIKIPELLEAAHIKGVQCGGSDHPLNGLMLCANHHKAYDHGLVSVDPESKEIVCSPEVSTSMLGVTKSGLSAGIEPAVEALNWHFERWKKGLAHEK